MWHFVVEVVLQVLIHNKICKFLSARASGWAGCVCADSKEGVTLFLFPSSSSSFDCLWPNISRIDKSLLLKHTLVWSCFFEMCAAVNLHLRHSELSCQPGVKLVKNRLVVWAWVWMHLDYSGAVETRTWLWPGGPSVTWVGIPDCTGDGGTEGLLGQCRRCSEV